MNNQPEWQQVLQAKSGEFVPYVKNDYAVLAHLSDDDAYMLQTNEHNGEDALHIQTDLGVTLTLQEQGIPDQNWHESNLVKR